MTAEPGRPVPLTELSLDLDAPVGGWAPELKRRGLAVVLDDLGRAAVDRETARALFAERREAESRAARHREESEQRAAAQAFQVAGVPATAIPEGLSPAAFLMLSDPGHAKGSRQSMVEHALAGGGLVFHPLNPISEDAS